MTTGITDLSDRFSGTAQAQAQTTSESPSAQETAPRDPIVPKKVVASQQANDAENNLKKAIEVDLSDPKVVNEVLDKLNLAIEKIQTGLNFSIDETRGDVIIKVVDQSTDETIRQIPSEEMLRIYQRLQEVNSLLFDDIKV
ncbi:MAG: flagellar protein FlaG [Pseudohongiellaceae bacterium]|jgi:flagellar protein FlaG